MSVYQQCINPTCGKQFGVEEILHACSTCGELLDVEYDWNKITPPKSLQHFEQFWQHRNNPHRLSGVWRFHDLLPFLPLEKCITIGEGQTILQQAHRVAPFTGLKADRLFLQYEGLNPSGSFKDNGMTAAFSHGVFVGAKKAACASTGNTSASLAIYSACTGLMQSVIFIGSGKIAYGKLSQALDYGAKTIQIQGDFDDAMTRVQQVSKELGIYLVNSVNPFRLEGQKTIMFRVLEALRWEAPDWIIVPGGNLGNSSSFGKAFIDLHKLGLIKKIPRLAVINAAGANTLYRLYEQEGLRWNGGTVSAATGKSDHGGCYTVSAAAGKSDHGGCYDKTLTQKFFDQMTAEGRKASTIASAIEINRPVNLSKCLRALDFCNGVVREVTEQEILDAKAQVGAGGLGCEPASAASVAGAKKLVAEGVIEKSDRVVCILTGHQLKDPNATVAYHGTDRAFFEEVLGKRGVTTTEFANRPISVANDLDQIVERLETEHQP